MANRGAASLHAVAIRVCQLSATGSHSAASNMYVTDNLMRLEFNPEVEAGTEVSDKNAAGNVAVTFRMPDVIKRLTLEVEAVYPDPELEVLLSGGNTFVSGAAVIGMQYPALNMPDQNAQINGISIELWTHAIVNGAIDNAAGQGFMRWVFPRCFLRKGNRQADINRMASVYSGYAVENPAWGSGPMADWTWDSSRVAQWTFANTAPTPALGMQKSTA